MTYLYITIILITLFLVFSWCNNYRLHTTNYIIKDENLPIAFRGKEICLLSDLHGNYFGKSNKKLIDRIHSQKPDYIVMAGDMVTKSNKGTEEVCKLCKELSSMYPVYASAGNHEDNIVIEVRSLYRENGVCYLENESTKIECNGESVTITGLSLGREFYGRLWKKSKVTLEDMIDKVGEKEDGYTILIAHNPEPFPSYARWGANLVLSGHHHGGVAILPFLGGVISPSLHLFPKYDYGIFKEGTSKMVLSKGLGLHGIKFRFFNIPEVVIIQFE